MALVLLVPFADSFGGMGKEVAAAVRKVELLLPPQLPSSSPEETAAATAAEITATAAASRTAATAQPVAIAAPALDQQRFDDAATR